MWTAIKHDGAHIFFFGTIYKNNVRIGNTSPALRLATPSKFKLILLSSR